MTQNTAPTHRIDPALLAGNRQPLALYRATHFKWQVEGGVATLTLNRPERKNPLTFESYAELRDLFGRLKHADDVHVVVLYTGRSLGGEEGERWGFFNRLVAPELLLTEAAAMARDLAAGPTFANGITKTMLHQEWAMTIEQAIEAEAQAQALCMLTEDFSRAYNAFVAKQKPSFEGN